MQVEKSVARGRGGIYLWDPKPPGGVWFGFPGLPGQRASDFFVLPDCRPKIIHSLPKDLQTPPQGAKIGAVCEKGALQSREESQLPTEAGLTNSIKERIMTTENKVFMSSARGMVAVILLLISTVAVVSGLAGFFEVRELRSSNALLAAESLAFPQDNARTYEYQSTGSSPSIDSLNEKGKEGWRLLPIATANTHGNTTYYCETRNYAWCPENEI